MGELLIGYLMMTAIVLIGAVLILDDDGRYPYRVLSDRERAWVGRAGLAAPLWPITALLLVALVVIHAIRRLVMAARGRG